MPILALLLALATFSLVLLAAGLVAPQREVAGLVSTTLRSRNGRLGLATVLTVIGFNIYETNLDGRIAPALGLDFTPWIASLEGDLPIWLQRGLAGHRLAPFWGWVYVFLYPCLAAAPVIAYYARRQHDALRGYVGAFAANYLLALPFYLFVPVTETGWFQPRTADPILENALPGYIEFLRSSSALDNCFPSLHASLTLTAAFFAARHGPRRLALTCWCGGALIVLSTWALGIHWVSDSVAGLLLAYAAARLGPALAAWLLDRPELAPQRAA